MFDFDENPRDRIKKASKTARINGIILAASNPCFELWIAMHFTGIDQRLTTRELSELVGRHILGYSKTRNYNAILFPLRDAAMERAEKIWGVDRSTDGSIEDLPNPGTSVYIAVRSIDELKSSYREGLYGKG